MTVRGIRVFVYILGRVYIIFIVFSLCSFIRRISLLVFKEWVEYLDWFVRIGVGNFIRKFFEV